MPWHMTNQRQVSQEALDRWFDWIIKEHEGDDYEQEDYYDYLLTLIAEKHCKSCKGTYGCNLCSLYTVVGGSL
jgi:hypothetical protein